MRISDWGSDVCSSDLDVLINNAGVFEANPIETADADWLSGWERTLDINLTAAALLCRRAVLHWREGGRDGRIVNIASRAAYRGDSPEHWHYAASQAWLVATTKKIARGHGRAGILAYAICHWFPTPGKAEANQIGKRM